GGFLFRACQALNRLKPIIKDMGKGSRAPSPSFCPVPGPATGSSTAPAGKPGRLCRRAFPALCDKNLFPGPEKFFFPRLFLCRSRPCGDFSPVGPPPVTRAVFFKKHPDFIEQDQSGLFFSTGRGPLFSPGERV
ncbi:hypothetical protein, partial [Desulfovibrio sp.]|uniref:hypothetical protein n=1 Tax=Desulfovibrio sp. TaxID=885 RepID=UPI003FF0C645